MKAKNVTEDVKKTKFHLIIGIAVLLFLVILAVVLSSDEYQEWRYKQDFNEDAVTATISQKSTTCDDTDFPLEVQISNVSDRQVLNVGFMINLADKGRSTEYDSRIIGSDMIVAPGFVSTECYAIPEFSIADNERPVPFVVESMLSPEYEIIVTGVKLQGDIE